MAYAKSDPQVLGYLGRALSLELSAVQQYLTLSRLLKLRGYDDLAERFQHEATEEMAHADRIIGRMLVLGAAPNASQLRPARLGESLPAVINSVKAMELEIVSFYQQAVEHCTRIDDFDNRLFFEQLLQEEKQHAGSFDDWQSMLNPKKQ